MKHAHIPAEYLWEEPLNWTSLLECSDKELSRHFWNAQRCLLDERGWRKDCKEAEEKRQELSHESREQGLEVIIRAQRARDFLAWLANAEAEGKVPL